MLCHDNFQSGLYSFDNHNSEYPCSVEAAFFIWMLLHACFSRRGEVVTLRPELPTLERGNQVPVSAKYPVILGKSLNLSMPQEQNKKMNMTSFLITVFMSLQKGIHKQFQ